MAAGEFILFDKFAENLSLGVFTLDDGDFRMGVITNTTPLITAVDPRWQATGANPDFSALETDATTGNYTADGEPLSATITDNWTTSGSVSTFDGDDIEILQDVNNPTGTGTSSAYWGIVYDWNATNKECVGFVDLGGPVEMVDGNFTITWDGAGGSANKMFTLTN